MKLIQLIFLSIVVTFCIESCKSSKNKNSEIIPTELIISQNNKELVINEMSKTVKIDKNIFSLRFYNKRYNSETKQFYAAQIAAFNNQNELNNIEIGMKKTDIPCFSLGTGMAPSESGKYERLILTNKAHHYTMYENTESKRLKLVQTYDNYLKLEFEISTLFVNNLKYDISDSAIKEFYIAVLIDRNLNGIIEQGELTKLTIQTN